MFDAGKTDLKCEKWKDHQNGHRKFNADTLRLGCIFSQGLIKKYWDTKELEHFYWRHLGIRELNRYVKMSPKPGQLKI